jgi:hypothetical protein
MQNSELFRRGFVVPLSKAAEIEVASGNVTAETLVEFYELPSARVFESLWEKGLFDEINRHLEVLINDYEETIIEHEKMEKLVEILRQFRKRADLDTGEQLVVDAWCKLGKMAKENKIIMMVVF